MTRDLIIGTLLSAALHALLLYGNWAPAANRATAMKIEDIIRIRWDIPRDEEEPDFIESADADATPLDLAPPTQPEVPQLAEPTVFVQKPQPPPPKGMVISKTMNIVPPNRNLAVYHKREVFDPSMLDQTPVPKFQTRPRYPHEMRRQGIPGEVLVDFIVDAEGEVRNATALRSSQREFEAAAVEAVSRWRFKPGRRAGRNVATHMQVPIVFTLNDGAKLTTGAAPSPARSGLAGASPGCS